MACFYTSQKEKQDGGVIKTQGICRVKYEDLYRRVEKGIWGTSNYQTTLVGSEEFEGGCKWTCWNMGVIGKKQN